MNKVLYKEIKDSDGYFAGSDGFVYSSWVSGKVPYKQEGKRKRLKGSLDRNLKYYSVNILLNGRRINKLVHWIIISTFSGDRPEGYTISHINGNSKDNRIQNLCYETYSDNLNRKKEHGTDDRGFKNSRAVFESEDIETIFKLKLSNLSNQKIADIMGVSRATISRVVNKKRYFNV